MWRRAFTMCVLGAMAIAGPQPCSVAQQRIDTAVTTTIALDGGSVSLTLPVIEFGLENMFLTLETHGPLEGMRLQVGDQSAPIQNGAVLHVHLKPLERFVFSVVRNGEVQCTWEPDIRTAGKFQRRIDAGAVTPFRLNEIIIHPVGGPVELGFYHKVEETPREFTLGGLPAIVLEEYR